MLAVRLDHLSSVPRTQPTRKKEKTDSRKLSSVSHMHVYFACAQVSVKNKRAILSAQSWEHCAVPNCLPVLSSSRVFCVLS